VDGEVVRLNRVVNDVLDFARPIRFDYAPTDVNALCVDAERASHAEREDLTVRVKTDPALPQIVTDAERLRMALVNILENARHAVSARSTPDVGAHPHIEIHTEKVGPAAVRIVVRDRGVGVSPDDLPRVFEPYFTTKRTGSGLGLAISKNIIEGMGGSIALDSRPGFGTEIRVDLPSHQQTPGGPA
jgi:signal transduction histidine kinase